MMTSEESAEVHPDLKTWSEIVENRREERFDFRTTGFVFPLKEEGMEASQAPVRIWTVDVSTTGALVRSYEPIAAERVLVELVLPQMAGSLIEGKLVRSKEDVAKYVNGKELNSYLYGIQFTTLVERKSVPAELLDHGKSFTRVDTLANRVVPEAVVGEESETEHVAEPGSSLVAILSAIGLAVVYAALEFVL